MSVAQGTSHRFLEDNLKIKVKYTAASATSLPKWSPVRNASIVLYFDWFVTS
jgi:hypothetical protein